MRRAHWVLLAAPGPILVDLLLATSTSITAALRLELGYLGP